MDTIKADDTVTKERPHLSASALAMKCMEAFRRRYILGERLPPGVAMIAGSGTHEAVRANVRSFLESGKYLPVEAIKEIARDNVRHRWEKGVLLQPDEIAAGLDVIQGEAIDKAVRLTALHHSEVVPTLKPKSVERPWALEIRGYPIDIHGRLDIEEMEWIRDTKTTSKSPTKTEAAQSIQLKIYSMALKAVDKRVVVNTKLDYLVNNKIPKYVHLEHIQGPADYRAVLNRIEVFTIALEKGVFVPVEPGHWCCDPKWCGYFDTCRYVRAPVQFAVA